MAWTNCAILQCFSLEQLCIWIQHLRASPYHSPKRRQHDYYVDWIFVWEEVSRENISAHLGEGNIDFEFRYSRVQVASVLILSVGIVISALGDAKSKVVALQLADFYRILCSFL